MNIWLIENAVNNYARLKINKDKLEPYEENLKKGIRICDLNENIIDIGYKKKYNDKIKYADTYAIENFVFCIVINERAKIIFDNELKIEAQYFELKSLDPKEKLYMMSLLRKKDIIDFEKSEYSLIMNKYIGSIDKYVFKDEVKEEYLFRCFKNGVLNSTHIYCTDRFKDIIEKYNIIGFEFEKIYEIE